MNPYPAVLVDGPWVKPADQFSHIQDETVRRLEIEVKRREREEQDRLKAEALKPKPWAVRAVVVEEVEEGRWQ